MSDNKKPSESGKDYKSRSKPLQWETKEIHGVRVEVADTSEALAKWRSEEETKKTKK